MRIITVSREFGSGGRELGKRLAEHLGFDYYDREIITAIAAEKGLTEAYVEKGLDGIAQRILPMTVQQSFSTPSVMKMPDTELLVAETRIIRRIAEAGRDCVIVGRNADLFLAEYKPLHIFVCADTESKIRRCVERAEEGENVKPRSLMRKMKRIDKNRAKTRALLSSIPWGDVHTYHLTVNTSGHEIASLIPGLAEYARRWFDEES